jgi:hypothetical protein
VDENNWTSDHVARSHIWLWGSQGNSPNDTPSAVAAEFKSREPKSWNLPIIQSLIKDLHASLYGERFKDVEALSPLFNCLRDRAEGFINHILISFDSQQFFETGRPISHIVVDIIACVNYLREKAEMKNDKSIASDQTYEITALREWFWHSKLGILP